MKQIEVMVRYTREFTISMFAYAVILVASNSLLARLPDPSSWRVPLALAPAVPVAFVLNAILRLLMSSDELQQRIQLSAIGFAAVATGMATFSYGFLEFIGFPNIPSIWILPMMIVFWGIGLALFARKYK